MLLPLALPTWLALRNPPHPAAWLAWVSRAVAGQPGVEMGRASGAALNPVLGQTALAQARLRIAAGRRNCAVSPTIIGTLLPFALGFIMFAVGVTLVPADFTRLFEQPRAVIAGLIGQLVLLPVLAWTMAVVFRLSPPMAVGLVILGACPGGASSALITHLARGSAALSVTLTAITSLVALVSMPIVVQGALRHFLGAGQSHRVLGGKNGARSLRHHDRAGRGRHAAARLAGPPGGSIAGRPRPYRDDAVRADRDRHVRQPARCRCWPTSRRSGRRPRA